VIKGPVDSTDFFTGPTSSTSYTGREAPMGNFYVSAFDSRGVRILSNTYSLLPAIDMSHNSNVLTSYDEYIGHAPRSYAMPKVYMTELSTNAKLVFNLQELTSEHCFGLLIPTDDISTGTNVYSKIEYGFYVKNGLIYTVEKGVKSSTSYTALINVPVEIVKSGLDIQLVYNGTVLQTYTPTGGVFAFKAGAYFTDWGTKIRIKPHNMQVLQVKIKAAVSDNSCSSTENVTVTVTFPTHTFHNTPVTSNTIKLYDQSGTPLGTDAQTLYSVPAGVYYLNGTINGYTVTQYVYAGYSTVWESQANLGTSALQATHAIGSSSVNPTTGALGYGIATGKLPAGDAGWMAFTPKSVSTADNFWLNTAALTEAPQVGMLEPPAGQMPSMIFPVSGGMLLVNNPATQTFSVRYYSPDVPILAQRNGSGVFQLSQNGTAMGSSISGYDFGYWKPSFLIRKAASGWHGIITNFKCPEQTDDIFAHMKYELDGYYHVMKNCNIRFLYNEEYNSATLTFNIYASNMTKLYDQSDFPTQVLRTGENHITLYVGDDAHCIGEGHFILEVINEKKEHFYLRFFNDSCASCSIEGEGSGGGGGDDE
jgi:hypothetical protein